MKFKGDIIITDPCYIMRDEERSLSKNDWDRCGYGRNMQALGIKTFLTRDTIYGDWSCTTFNSDKKDILPTIRPILNKMYAETFDKYNDKSICKTDEDKKRIYNEYIAAKTKVEQESGAILGHFCADAGMVSVFLLEEVLAYNPDFDYHINNTHTTTWIKDFDGDIEIDIVSTSNKGDEEVRVIGTGNINFFTSQTGF